MDHENKHLSTSTISMAGCRLRRFSVPAAKHKRFALDFSFSQVGRRREGKDF